MNSVGMVTVQFEVGEDKENSLVKLYDRVMGNRDRLPSGASEPLIKSVDVDDVPIVTITLASEKYDDYALKRLADHMIERLLPAGSFASGDTARPRGGELLLSLPP